MPGTWKSSPAWCGMKLVTRDELMKLPAGTIYRAWEPAVFTDDWMRKGETCAPSGENIDWFESPIGPHWASGDSWGYQLGMNGIEALPENLRPLVENGELPDHFEISDMEGREGLFDARLRYLVLDEDDIKAMIAQLTTGLPDGGDRYYKEPQE